MTKNQLFSCVPELNVVDKLLSYFGLEDGIKDKNSFIKLNSSVFFVFPTTINLTSIN